MGVEMDIAKALDLYSQSGKQGHASALIRLGYLYQFGMAEPGTDTYPAQWCVRIECWFLQAFSAFLACVRHRG